MNFAKKCFQAGPRRVALLALLPLAFAACNDDHGTKVKIDVPTLAAGAHTVVIGGDDHVRDGTAFIGGEGAAYVAMADDSNQASTVVYRRDKSSAAWRRVPRAADDLTLGGQLDEAQTIAAWAPPASATTYRVRIGEITSAVTLAPDGKLTANADGCKLSGKIVMADLGNAASAALTFKGCGSGDGEADGDYDGIAYVDPEAPNAAFRVIVDNGSGIRDFYAYAP